MHIDQPAIVMEQSICPENVREIINLARKVHRGLEKNPIEKCEQLVKCYTADCPENSRQQFVHQLVEKCPLFPLNYVIQQVDSDDNWSEDDVFRVFERGKKTPFLCLKIYNQNGFKKNFFNEIFGMGYLNKIGIPSPELLAVGKYDVNDQRYFMIAETAVPGYSLKSLLQEVAKHPEGTLDRREAYVTLCKATQAVANTLGMLHSKKGYEQPFPQDLERQFLYDLENVQRLIPDLQGLDAYAKAVLEEIKMQEFIPSATHGDPKLAHVFFPTNRFSAVFCGLIDPTLVAKSIDEEGNPIGIPLEDYYHFIYSIKLNRFYYDDEGNKSEVLTLPETHELVVQFEKTYAEKTGKRLSEVQRNYYLAAHLLKFISRYSNFTRESLSLKAQIRMRDLALVCTEELRELVQSSLKCFATE
jgi:hypothetical protein